LHGSNRKAEGEAGYRTKSFSVWWKGEEIFLEKLGYRRKKEVNKYQEWAHSQRQDCGKKEDGNDRPDTSLVEGLQTMPAAFK